LNLNILKEALKNLNSFGALNETVKKGIGKRNQKHQFSGLR